MTPHDAKLLAGAATGIAVIGVDIGTTSTKVVAYDQACHRPAEAEHGYPLDAPHPGEAVQDPRLVLEAVLTGLDEVAGRLRGDGVPIAGISFSSAMHSLLAVDDATSPPTPSIPWADSRAIEQAERLRTGAAGRELYQHTGTPVHPMSPFTKLVWFRDREPEVFAAARRWLGIKEYVLAHLTGELVMDRSIASATGLLDLTTLAWWPPALALASIRAEQLPPVVPTTQILAFREPVSGALGLDRVPIVVGAGDGPLANLGAGAVRPGVAACSIGTSGAMRVIVEHAPSGPIASAPPWGEGASVPPWSCRRSGPPAPTWWRSAPGGDSSGTSPPASSSRTSWGATSASPPPPRARRSGRRSSACRR